MVGSVAQIEGRQLHLVKKALAIATLTIEQQADGPFRPTSDQADMKELLSALTSSEIELETYIQSARIVIRGGPDHRS
jgi:hypothetical protein